MFWYVSGVGLMEQSEFRAWSSMIRRVCGKRIIPPPFFESDLPIGHEGPLEPAVESMAFGLLGDAVWSILKRGGRSERLKERIAKADETIRSVQRLLVPEIQKGEFQ